jgi:hypothetical protein
MIDGNIQLNNTRNTLLLCLAAMVMRKRHNVTLLYIAYLIGLLTGSKEIRIWYFEVCCDYVNENDVFRKLALNSQKTTFYTFTNISLCNAQNSEEVSHISTLLSQHVNEQYKNRLVLSCTSFTEPCCQVRCVYSYLRAKSFHV